MTYYCRVENRNGVASYLHLIGTVEGLRGGLEARGYALTHAAPLRKLILPVAQLERAFDF